MVVSTASLQLLLCTKLPIPWNTKQFNRFTSRNLRSDSYTNTIDRQHTNAQRHKSKHKNLQLIATAYKYNNTPNSHLQIYDMANQISHEMSWGHMYIAKKCWILASRSACSADMSLCSLGLSANRPAVLFSHNKSAPAISHSQANTAMNEEWLLTC